jgi:hypothetical protein
MMKGRRCHQALSAAGKSPQVPVFLVDRMKKKMMIGGKNVQK